MRRGAAAAAALALLVVAIGFVPPADASGSHGQNWSFTQGGIVGTFRGYHYNSAYDNPVAYTTNVQYTCYQGVRLTHSQSQMGWKYSVYPHTYVDQYGPVFTTTVSSLHYSQHCWNLAGLTRTLN
ncbi:MAG: hypothetical protein WEA29_07110 [Acidimicrobiia bacterium]